MDARPYLDAAVPEVDRLLSNMDRNTDAETYGCLCRPYWHDKVMDFPSAHQQIGVLPLAIMYGNDLPGNPYHRDEAVQACSRAGIRYWASIQRRNGSFDEHYPREHSLGATAWSLWAVASAMQHLDSPPTVEEAVERAVDFLAAYDEPGTLANHQAVTASALHAASHIIDVPRAAIRERVETVKRLQSPEGWFQEYRGGDPGYQSTTIAHLARIWRANPEMVDETMLERALEFFAAFIDADNYYGAGLGSRRTQHVHPAGFEILAEEFETASSIASHFREHVADRRVLVPRVVDDKHFSWLQAEYLEAALFSTEAVAEEASMRVEGQRFRDFLIRAGNEEALFINLARGGHMKQYRDGELVAETPGVAARISGRTYTADWTGATDDISVDDGTVRLAGNLHRVPDNRLKWGRYTLLRMFQHTLGRLPTASLRMKNALIRRLITGGRSGHRFERVIEIDDATVEDSHPGERLTGKTRSMFIPNSEYAHPTATEPPTGR